MNNRIGILQAYAGTKGIERYVYYLASELRKIVRTLVVVNNGVLSETDRRKMSEITTYLYEREDIGYDCGAFKDTLENFVTWNRMEQYEELILVNDSCYGPLYPLEEMFKEMNQNRYDLDFWAVTEQEAYRSDPAFLVNDIPYHIQPYFVVVRKRLLHSEAFRNFWSTLDIPNNYDEAVRNYELKFAAYFNKFGYKGGAYIDNSEFCRTVDERMAYVMFNIYRLISKYRSPLVKRKAFKFPQHVLLAANAGEVVRKTLEYVRQNTTYDSDMILEDMIHHMELAEIQEILHLNYIISDNSIMDSLNKKICMCFLLNDMDYAQSCIERIRKLPVDITVCIASNKEAVINAFSSNGLENIVIVKSITNYLRENREFDYYFFCIDHLSEFDFGFQSVKQSYIDLILDNMAAGLNYTNKVIKFFEEERLLGVLVPPEPHFSNLLSQNRSRKEKKFNGLFTVNNAYWVKKEIVETFLDIAATEFEDDFGEKLLQLVKYRGYYCGVLMSELYASLYVSSHHYIFNSLPHLRDYIEMSTLGELMKFCFSFAKLYVYGTGNNAVRMTNCLHDFNMEYQGYIVSDGHRKYKEWNEKPVYILSEIEDETEEVGIILALDKKFQPEVLSQLKKKGYRNIYKMWK